jgi:ATP-dependent DNA ligase
VARVTSPMRKTANQVAATDKQVTVKPHVKDQATRTWVKPLLVAEVKFSEWTAAGEMRHPAFLGLREDKKPKDVMLEKEVHRKG